MSVCKVVTDVMRPLIALALLWPALSWSLTVTVVNDGEAPLADAVVVLTSLATQAVVSEATADMDQRDRQFVPQVLVVQQGTTVAFPNSDNIRHHVYSFSPTKKFELRLYHGTTAAPVVFEQPGKVVLGCNIHDSMLGYIFVVDSPYFALTGADGEVELSAPAGDYQLSVQHPRSDQMYTVKVNLPMDALKVQLGPVRPDPREADPQSELEALFQK